MNMKIAAIYVYHNFNTIKVHSKWNKANYMTVVEHGSINEIKPAITLQPALPSLLGKAKVETTKVIH